MKKKTILLLSSLRYLLDQIKFQFNIISKKLSKR